MTKKILLAAMSFLTVNIAVAQTTSDAAKKAAEADAGNLTKNKADLKYGWTKGGTINININESGVNNEWASIRGGEKFALGIKGILDYSFDRKKEKSSWLNSFRARYGVSRLASVGDKFLKTDDYFNFTSIYGKEFKKSWSYAAFFSVESQFDHYLMTPGYIKLGPGVLYQPNENFNVLVSPAMLNLITKFAPSEKPYNKFGVDSGKTVALGLGAFVQIKFSKDIAKGVNYKTVGSVYSNYLDHPGNMVLDWSNLITLTVNKYIGATVSFNARYNDLEVSRMQIQHGIGVGLSYKL